MNEDTRTPEEILYNYYGFLAEYKKVFGRSFFLESHRTKDDGYYFESSRKNVYDHLSLVETMLLDFGFKKTLTLVTHVCTRPDGTGVYFCRFNTLLTGTKNAEGKFHEARLFAGDDDNVATQKVDVSYVTVDPSSYSSGSKSISVISFSRNNNSSAC